jgi:serine/threonine protein kinase
MLSKSQFGEVWKVRFSEDSSLFTLKKLLKNKIKRVESQFIRELSRWFKIRHKNLQQLSSFSEDEDFFYLLMEHLEGLSLQKRLQQGPKPEKSFCKSILIQVLEVLEHLHSLHPPVIYKHVHPESIFIDSSGIVKLADSSWPGGSLEQDSGSTLDYLAPEMFGKADFGTSVDVWAVGVLAFELLAGHSPFRKTGSHGVLAHIQKGNFKFPHDFDVGMKKLLAQVLVIDPLKRLTASQVKGHKWFLTRKVEVSDLIDISKKYFHQKIIEKKKENQQIVEKIQNIQENIEILNENCEKIQEKIRNFQQVSEILTDENEKVGKNLDYLMSQEFEESNEAEIPSYSGQIEKLKQKMSVLEMMTSTLLSTRDSRANSLVFLSSNQEILKTRLFFLNEFNKSMQSFSLLMAKALVFSVSGADVEVFNDLSSSVNFQFSQSCESLLTKIQDMDNLIFLKERYLCELSVLYQEKQKELLQSYLTKKNELEAKRRKNKEENLKSLKRFTKDLMNKQGKGFDFSDFKIVEEKRKTFHEIFEKMKEVQRKVQLAKRDLLKIRVRAYRTRLDLNEKVKVLDNLTEALMQAKAGMKIFKARRIC